MDIIPLITSLIAVLFIGFVIVFLFRLVLWSPTTEPKEEEKNISTESSKNRSSKTDRDESITADPQESEPVKKENEILVFISAKSDDYEYAHRLYQYLSRHNTRCFFSNESLRNVGRTDYSWEIEKALEEARHLIVVTSSKENAQSGWVRAEWGMFLSELRAGRKEGNLMTVTVGSLKPSALPLSLRSHEVVPIESLDRVLSFVQR